MSYRFLLLVLLLVPAMADAQVWRINCGGDDFTTAGGVLFEQDPNYTPGSYGYLNGTPRNWFPNEILGTEDDTLYSTMRFLNATFAYQFDGVPSGTYELNLHFIEPSVSGPDGRLIDVIAEGDTLINDLDIWVESGGMFTALVKTVQVEVTDDTLLLEFDNVLSNNALVSAIEVEMISSGPTTYVDVASVVGLTLTHATAGICGPPIGVGSAWGDYDNDGDVDLYVTNQGGANHLYRNDGDINFDNLPDFVDEAAAMGVDAPASVSLACVFIDIDNDGDQDLYVTNWGGNTMYRNELVETGSVSFTDITTTSGLTDDGRAMTAGWADFDGDGFLDVYLAKHLLCMGGPNDNQDRLFRNNGDGTFADVTDYLCDGAAPCAAVMGLGFSPGWVDYDNDGDMDLYLVNDILDGSWQPNVLWRNDGDNGVGGWTFTDVSLSSGADKAVNGMGLGIADYDNDGYFDFAFSNVGPNSLLRNLGDGTFDDVSAVAGIERPLLPGGGASITWGSAFFDHDNDGLQDLLFVAGVIGTPVTDQADAFFRNNGDGTFTDVSDASGLNHPGRARNATVNDFDADGYPDVYIGHFAEAPVLMRNEAGDQGNTNNWLQFTLEGTASNRDAIGARVTVSTGDGVTQIREISSGATHGGGDQRVAMFGIGGNADGDVVVRWPSGLEEDFGTVSANQRLHLIENSTQRTYADITAAAGLVLSHDLDATCPMPPIGSGSAWADYDGDGDIDLFVTNHGGPNHLYRNDGDQGLGFPEFTDVAVDLGVADSAAVSAGCVFVDYDNDGDHDLYVTHWGGNSLYQNQLIESGTATFVDVTAMAGVGDDDRAITATWGDYDQDGYLDLFLAKHFDCMPDPRDTEDKLFKNNGDGTFSDVSGLLCPGGTLPCDQMNEGHGFMGGWFDYDDDGDLDIYLVNDVVASGYPNVLWRNDGPDTTGAWVFTDVSTASGMGFSVNGMGLGIGDYDNDQDLDVAFSHSNGGRMVRNNGDGTFTDVTDSAGVRASLTPNGDTRVTWGTMYFDHDNDGLLDLYYVAGTIGEALVEQPNAFFRNNGDGTFEDMSVSSGLDHPGRGRSASMCDFDRDGFVDLFVGNFGEPPVLYQSNAADQGNTNNWLTVTVEGTASNRDGIGARLWLTTGDGVTQIREISSGPTHGGGDYKAAYFGLGSNVNGDLVIRWPNGLVEDYGTVSSNQEIHLTEGGVTSVTTGGVVHAYALNQNYPNPFNPSTTIRYSVQENTWVTLKVYNIVGQEIATLVDQFQTSGAYSVEWNGKSKAGHQVATGMYIYRISAGDFVKAHKMILSK